VRAFDQFHEVAAETNAAIAARAHDLGIDILVDLKGYTGQSRVGALAWRPSPVQVTYLGYPGTSGASFIDYVIADPIVVPFADQPFYTERIVHLPGCYQANDDRREISGAPLSRAHCGLPERGFVFCCFNSNHKISREMFDVWMRLLAEVPDSVLWLLRSSEETARRLALESETRGIAPSRLVFAPLVEHAVHLARHRLADLALDTLPYNAHTTGSDALWGGLPVLTCLGPTFAGRVGASLLNAVGLPELVTSTLADYEALAVRLARDPNALASLRQRLDSNRQTSALFDTKRFCRNIEAAYATMFEIAARGEAPRSFAVEETPDG
jgi:predicted O-linked N-acetylglucosamine transferase (SPINDLY family)